MKKFLFVIVLLSCMIFTTCTKDKGELDYSGTGYPQEVGRIIVTSCATTGCHNEKSKTAAAGLSLESWETLFEGSNGGAVVIPYRPDFSTLMYYVNTYDELGDIRLSPTMPIGKPPLSREEVATLKAWIEQGAPDAAGNIKFSSYPGQKKVYVANQGCDVVTVFDAKSNLAMRYVTVGVTPSTEAPHMVRVSPDNQYWYVIFYAGNVIQKFRTSDDSYAGQATIGLGSWNTFAITSDSRKAFVVDWNSNGKIAYVDLENMQLLAMYQGTGLLNSPHGSAVNNAMTALYITGQTGNFIYKIDITDPMNPDFSQVVLETGQPVNTSSSLDPHEIIFSPDETKYFVSCQKSDEVRVMQTSNDSLLAVIPVGEYPVEMGISATHPYLFVSCMEDTAIFSSGRSAISVINYQTHSLITHVYAGYQSHGVAVDDDNGKVYITNRNVNSGGPAPHHASVCAGRNGNVTIIDMNSLQLVPGFKAEVSVDPYGIGITH
jgi:YVTN family beta-propeller protein